MKCGGNDGHIIRIKFNMNDLSQRLRELSDVLIGCEWEVPLCASEDCIKAANEIERLTSECENAREAARLFARDTLLTRGELLRWPWIVRSEAAGGK